MVLCSIILQGIAEPNLSKKALRSMAHVVLQIEREKGKSEQGQSSRSREKTGEQ
jgi:hypothetical protein